MERDIFMKSVRSCLILLITLLMMFAIGCSKGMEQSVAGSSDSKGDYKQLKGKLISQGVFPAEEDIKGITGRNQEGLKVAEMLYGKGKYMEFVNDKELIIGNQKLKYECIDNEQLSLTNSSNNSSIYKYSYNNGVFRFYHSKNLYVDFIKEGSKYTPEKPSIEDTKHPSIDVGRNFLTNVGRILNDSNIGVDFVSYISPQFKDKLIGQVSDKGLEDGKIREVLKPLSSSIKELNMEFQWDADYRIKEKSDSKTVIEVYAKGKLFKTLTLELIDSKWKVAEIN